MKIAFHRRSFAAPAVASAMVLSALGLFALWDLDLSRASASEDDSSLTRSSRGMKAGASEAASFSEFSSNTPKLDPSASGGGTPRVNLLDKVISPDSAKADAGDEPYHESAIAAAQKAQRQDRISGLRRRLLMEAAERALDSETPWADLALVALGFKKAGDEQAARYWFDRASRLAMDPDDARGASRALRDVVKSAVAARYFGIATELIARIPDGREKSMARAELVKAYARGKNFVEARELAMSLGDVQAKGMALRSLAEAEARFEGLDTALTTLQMITHPSERDRAYGSVASVRAAMGDSDGSMSLIHQIKNVRARDAALAKVATIQERGGAVSMEALAGLIHDPTFRNEILREVIVNEATRLGVDVASSSVARIETAAARAKAYESLVMLQIRQGDLDGALARAQSIRQEGSRFRALQAVAVAEVRGDGAVSARNIANLIGDFEMREGTYGKIAQRAALYGQHRGAVDTIQFIDDPIAKAMAFASVALTQARYGLDRQALILTQDANRELAKVENVGSRARTQGLLAEVFAETGDSGAAMSTAASISNAGLRDVTYQRVALSFAKVSNPVLASRSAQLIQRETVRERAFASIATTLARRVSLTQAVRYSASLNGHSQQVRFLLGVAGRKS